MKRARITPGRAGITLALGVALLVGIGAYTLTRSAVRVLPPGGAPDNLVLGSGAGDFVICQPNEVLPAGTTAIGVPLIAFYGANLKVSVFSGGRLLTTGSRGPNWTGFSANVPVKPVADSVSGATICFDAAPNSEPLLVVGGAAPTRDEAVALPGKTLSPAAGQRASERLPGRLAFEFVASGRSSWWSRIVAVARHMGLGRAYSGTWIALLVALMMLIVTALALRLASRELP